MESKTLNTIQTVAKIGKILSTIAYVFCLVGGICCIVGIACVGIPGSIKIGGVTIHSMIDNLQGLSLETCYTAMAMGLIVCASICVVAKMSERYFKNELAAGTPFTAEGASELLRLGICTICIPLGAIVAAEACNAIASHCLANVAEINIDGGAPIVLGVAFIIMSLVCKSGTEMQETRREAQCN